MWTVTCGRTNSVMRRKSCEDEDSLLLEECMPFKVLSDVLNRQHCQHHDHGFPNLQNGDNYLNFISSVSGLLYTTISILKFSAHIHKAHLLISPYSSPIVCESGHIQCIRAEEMGQGLSWWSAYSHTGSPGFHPQHRINGVVVHTCNLSIEDVEEGRPGVQGHPQLGSRPAWAK